MDISNFLIISVFFTLIMFLLALRSKHNSTLESFFAAGKNVGCISVAVSTAASWQWADNLFSTAQIGYDYGIYGILWFTIPTILSFVIFAFMANKIRQQASNALTIPEFVALKTNHSQAVHVAMALAVTLYQLFTLTLGATVTGLLLQAAFGFDYITSASSVIILALTYSLVSGLKASVLTDVLQFTLMFGLMLFMIVIMIVGVEPGMITKEMLFGTDATFTSFFNTNLVIELGIPLSIIIIAQPIVDQMIYQRLVAYKKGGHPIKPFILTAILCGTIVFVFSMIGVLGQTLVSQGLIVVIDSQLTIVETVRYFLSDLGLTIFVLAFLGVVFSTTDSAYSSIASLLSIDVYKRYFTNNKTDETKIILAGRVSMILAAILAILMSLAKLEILWMLFIIGAAGGTVVAPVAFSVFAKKLSPKIVVWSIMLSILFSVPLSIYGNITGSAALVSIASLSGIVIGVLLCGFDVLRQRWTVS